MPVFDLSRVAKFAIKVLVSTSIFSLLLVVLSNVKIILSDIITTSTNFSLVFPAGFCDLGIDIFLQEYLLIFITAFSIYISVASSLLFVSYLFKYYDRVFK